MISIFEPLKNDSIVVTIVFAKKKNNNFDNNAGAKFSRELFLFREQIFSCDDKYTNIKIKKYIWFPIIYPLDQRIFSTKSYQKF